MEKLLYLVERPANLDTETFSAKLRTRLADTLLANGVRRLQINVCDQAVAPAAHMRQLNSSAAFDGMITLWLDSAFDSKRIVALIEPFVHRCVGYVVTESERVPNTRHPAAPGERTTGYSQVVTLQRPPRLSYEAWFDYWQNVHAQIGIDIQSTFRYVQNIVVRRATWDAPVIDAIVEECFPAGAMTDPHIFYDAHGDAAKYQERYRLMQESCLKFIDFDRIDVVPTSEYVMK